MLGALQAQMVLAVLLGHDPSPLGQMVQADLAFWRLTSFRFDTAPEPDHPGPAVIAACDIGPDDMVVELRPLAEALRPAHPRALRQLPETLVPGQRVVFACATGLRAWSAAQALSARTGNPVAILAAGE